MTISLTRFCKDRDLPKTSVYRRCQELKIDITNGLDEATIARLDQEFAAQVAAKALRPEVLPGNHASAITLKTEVQATSLEQFRTDRIRQYLSNPQEMMEGIDLVLDSIEEGMEAAELQQEQELQQLRQVKRKAQKRLEQFRRRTDEYRLKTDILASIQNSELDEIEDLQEEVNSLGKRGTQSSQPSQS